MHISRIIGSLTKAVIIFAAVGFVPKAARAQAASPAKAGVSQVTAVNDHTFRLHVVATNIASKHQSLFIATGLTEPTVKSEKVREGTFSGVKNAGGALLVDEQNGKWMLEDAQGKVVIPATPLPSLGSDRNGQSQWNCPMGTGIASAAIYGSGDMNGGILQQRGQSLVDNGVTGVPFYWSSTGYSALALGEDDNAPANWQKGDDGGITWAVPGNSVDLYLTPAPQLQQAEEAYAQLTGLPPVPPRWAMGYMQSRWGWQDKAYIDDTLKQFTDRKLPVDAFIFDFEWYTKQPDYSVPSAGATNYSDFSWNPVLFPDPAKQVADLHAHGVHVVGIRKPRLGDSESLSQLRNRGWIVSASDLRGGSGRAPAGSRGTEQRLLNYGKPEVREWYAKQLVPLIRTGIDGWWNDEGEQSYTTYTYWNQSEVLALSEANPGARLWTINRAFQPGMQRYGAAAWTGDIQSNWRALADTPTKLLNWSLAGMYYGACDIGGFTGQDSPELLTRWMEAGVFFPVMRSHSVNRVQPRFPWLYGDQAEAAMRKALDLRYRLVPYYYSLAHVAAEKGTPLMRPLAMANPDDRQAANLTSQWLMGDGLMAAPVLAQTNQRSIYFPKGTWFEFDSNKTQAGGQSMDVSAALDQIPVFVREGTILPLGPVIQHTDELPGGPLDLQVYPGADASFTLTEDDGKTIAYANGQERKTTFTWNNSSRVLNWKIQGPYRGKDIFKEARFTVFDPKGVKTGNISLEQSGEVKVAP